MPTIIQAHVKKHSSCKLNTQTQATTHSSCKDTKEKSKVKLWQSEDPMPKSFKILVPMHAKTHLDTFNTKQTHGLTHSNPMQVSNREPHYAKTKKQGKHWPNETPPKSFLKVLGSHASSHSYAKMLSSPCLLKLRHILFNARTHSHFYARTHFPCNIHS